MWLNVPLFGWLLIIGMDAWWRLSRYSCINTHSWLFILINILQTNSSWWVKYFVGYIFTKCSIDRETSADTRVMIVLITLIILIRHINCCWSRSILIWNWILIVFEGHHVHGNVGQMTCASPNKTSSTMLSIWIVVQIHAFVNSQGRWLFSFLTRASA